MKNKRRPLRLLQLCLHVICLSGLSRTCWKSYGSLLRVRVRLAVFTQWQHMATHNDTRTSRTPVIKASASIHAQAARLVKSSNDGAKNEHLRVCLASRPFTHSPLFSFQMLYLRCGHAAGQSLSCRESFKLPSYVTAPLICAAGASSATDGPGYICQGNLRGAMCSFAA